MKLIDFPKNIPLSSYDETRNEILEKHKNISDICAVVEWGTIPLPGISDMDFHIVIEPNAVVNLPSFKSYSEEQRYMMMHKHFAVSKNSFPFMHYFDPWLVHMDPIIGDKEKYSMPNKPFGEDEYLALSYHFMLVNGLLSFLGFITEALCDGKLEVREFFECAKYVEYHIKQVLKPAGIVSNDFEDTFPTTLRSLREQWFDLSKEEQENGIRNAFSEWQKSLSRLFGIMATFFSEKSKNIQLPHEYSPRNGLQKRLMRAYPESIIVDTGSEIFVYEKSRTETELVQEHFIGLPYPRNIYLLPLSLSAIQNIHLFHDGPVSMQYQKCFFTDLAEIPLFSHPALTTLLDKMKNNVEETRNVSGAKHPFYTYGMPGITPHRTLRSTLGSIYDSYYEKFTRTFLGRILRKKYVTSKL